MAAQVDRIAAHVSQFLEKMWSANANAEVPATIEAETDRRSWKEVRVFVCSSFSDFYFEREILVKSVFPRLRAWGESRRIHVIDVDLRWGVTAEATTQSVLRASYQELERCRECNVCPYFIYLLGEHYGWVPDRSVLPPELLNQFGWLPGASLPHMEAMLGAYRDGNPNALFLFRSESSLATLPDKFRSQYRDERLLYKAVLKDLKERIRERFGQSQVFDYEVTPSVVETVTAGGVEKMQFDGMDYFSSLATTFLTQAIDRQYPPLQSFRISLGESLAASHDSFAANASRLLIGRDMELAQLLRSLEIPTTSPITIFGDSGSGKSALLATLGSEASKLGHRTLFHTSHVPDGLLSIYSEKHSDILKFRMCLEWGNETIRHQVTKYSDNIGTSEHKQEISNSFNVMIRDRLFDSEITPRCPALLLIDQLEGFDGFILGGEFVIPLPLPPHLRCVLSTSSRHHCDKLAECSRGKQSMAFTMSGLPSVVKLEQLDTYEMSRLVRAYLRDFRKTLLPDQLDCLLANPGCASLRWVRLACENLRVFGSLETLSAHIAELPRTVGGLLRQLLQSTEIIARASEGEDGRYVAFIRAALMCVLCSSSGLKDEELRDLIARCTVARDAVASGLGHTLPSIDPLSSVELSVVFLYIKPFVTTMIGKGGGGSRLVMHSREIQDMVALYYAEQDGVAQEAVKQSSISCMLDYFEACPDRDRYQEEYPSLLISSSDMHRVGRFRRTEEFRRLDYLRRRMIMMKSRCVMPVMMTPRPRSERLCLHCSMKSTIRADRLNKFVCSLCGDQVYSTARMTGQFTYQLGHGEAEIVMCRTHSFKAYQAQNFPMSCMLCKLPADAKNSMLAVMCRLCALIPQRCCQMLN